MTPTPQSLISAYEKAEYHVRSDHSTMILRIHEYLAEFDLFLSRHGALNGALISAYNPQSERVDEATNHHAHSQLEKTLISLALIYYPATGVDPCNVWPQEPGFMILGLTQEQALVLAQRFGQLAFVWVEYGHSPQLVWL